MNESDISHEDWREYDFGGRIYRIDAPKTMYYRNGGNGGTTHRIVTADGIAHCLPAPGVLGCVVRWYTPTEKGGPVNF